MNCHSLVFLNIPSYASGKKPWKNEEGYERQSFSDGKIEIVGFHTADFVSKCMKCVYLLKKCLVLIFIN